MMADKPRRTIYETKEAKKSKLFKNFDAVVLQDRRSFNFCTLDAMQEYIDNHKKVDSNGQV